MSIFTPRQEAELITAIQGRGEIPLKFVYLGPQGAKNWSNIAHGRMKVISGINTEEASLLTEKVSIFTDALPKNLSKINLIDIGCGDGYPVFPILKEFKRRKIRFRYVPLDISGDIIALAVKNIEKEFGRIESKSVLLDFEQGNFSDVAYDLKADGSYNLFAFLGSTLGNQTDMNRVLSNFRDSMDANDFMLVGVELSNLVKIDDVLLQYNLEDVGDFLYYIPETIGIGRAQTEFSTTWNEPKSQVEIRITLKNEGNVKIGKYTFVLKKKERLLLSRSVKFTSWTLTKLLADVGFRTEILATDRMNSYTISMVQPTRFV